MIISRIPEYAASLARALLGFTVNEHGRVVNIIILEPDNQAFTGAAIELT